MALKTYVLLYFAVFTGLFLYPRRGLINIYHDSTSGWSWVEDFFMKNVIKVLGIIALAAVIGLSFAGCDTGEGGDPPEPAGPSGPQKMVYTWKSGVNNYRLEITEASEGRAVYKPKTNDTYVLTINPGNKKSSGTVTVSSSGKESTFTLKPANSGTTFTVKAVETATNVLITGMTGTITLEDATTVPTPTTVTPVKEYATFPFTANIWYYAPDDQGEHWVGGLVLSDFTTHIPKKGDKLIFSLSGTTDTEMKWFEFYLHQKAPWLVLGPANGWQEVTLSETFDKPNFFVVNIEEDPRADAIYITMDNKIWQMSPGGNPNPITNNGRLPAGTKQGDVMATVRNFKISLDKIEPKN
jgi:hypothetical protein